MHNSGQAEVYLSITAAGDIEYLTSGEAVLRYKVPDTFVDGLHSDFFLYFQHL